MDGGFYGEFEVEGDGIADPVGESAPWRFTVGMLAVVHPGGS